MAYEAYDEIQRKRALVKKEQYKLNNTKETQND